MKPLHQCGFIVAEPAFRPKDKGDTVPGSDCLKYPVQACGRITGVTFVRKDHCIERFELCDLRVRRHRKSTRLNSSHVSISYAVSCSPTNTLSAVAADTAPVAGTLNH